MESAITDASNCVVDFQKIFEMRLPVFGGVPERSKGADCKSVGSAFGGSNPPPSTS
jgi:hypothetical protein